MIFDKLTNVNIQMFQKDAILKPKLLIITGATAVGKSETAVQLAQLFRTEIIGADSMQIYRGLNIGTGKITKEEMRGIPHHMIDVAFPHESYSVGKYMENARKIIDDLHTKNKAVIVSGGTGLYLNALIHGYNLAKTAGSKEIREQYYALAQSQGNDAIYDLLYERDPESAKKISKNDIKRIIRALEILELTGEKKSSRADLHEESEFNALMIILTRDREELYKRINLRVDEMVRRGLEKEVRDLQQYKNCQSMQAIGYKEFFDYFDGLVDLNVAIEKIKLNSRRYAKRQQTFFRGIKTEKVYIQADDMDTIKLVAHKFFNGLCQT